MGVNQDVQELIFRYDTTNLTRADADLKKVAASTAVSQKEFAAFNRELEISDREFKQFNQTMDVTAKEFAQFNKVAHVSADEFARFNKGVAGVKIGTNEATRATIELTRGFQDFAAAGLYGIANNVEGITLALKGLFSGGIMSGLKALSAGMMGPAGLITGFTLLTVLGPSVARAFGGFLDQLDPDRIKPFADEVENLKKQAEAAALTFDQLNDKAKTAFQGDVEQESGRKVGDFLRNTGAARAASANLIEQETNRLLNEDPNVMKYRGELGTMQAQIREAGEGYDQSAMGQEAARLSRQRVAKQLAPLIDQREAAIQAQTAAKQKTAEATVTQRLTAPGTADQELLANQFAGLGMADIAAGIRERGVGAVQAERTKGTLMDAWGDLKGGFGKATQDRVSRNAAREKAAQERQKIREAASEMTPAEERFFAQAEESGKAATEARQAAEQNRKQDLAGQLAEVQAEGEQRNIQADYARLQRDYQALMMEVQRLQAMGANQMQVAMAHGADLEDIQRRNADLEQRVKTFQLKEQQRRNNFQQRNPGP